MLALCRAIPISVLVGLIFLSTAHAEVITFEDLPDADFFGAGNQNIGNFYPGITFGADVTGLSVTRFGGYASAAFPPHSGDVVVWDASDATITIDFAFTVQSFGIWYTSFDPLTLKAFNGSNAQVGTVVGNPNTDGTTGTASFISFSASAIQSITLTSTAGLFTLDDLTFQPAPEPGTYVLSMLAFLGFMVYRLWSPQRANQRWSLLSRFMDPVVRTTQVEKANLMTRPLSVTSVGFRGYALKLAAVSLFLSCTLPLSGQVRNGILSLVVSVDNTWTEFPHYPYEVFVSASGPASISGSGSVTASVPPGGYLLSASSLNGYASSGWSCGSVAFVTSGGTTVCGIVFSAIPAALTLGAVVDNRNGGNALPTDWDLDASGPTPIIFGKSGTALTTNVRVKPGVYTLSAFGGPLGYASSPWSCGGGPLFLSAGETVTCVINFASQPAVLTLSDTVNTNNGGNAQPTDWTLHAVGTSTISGVTGSPNVTNVPVKWGTYTLSESGGPSGYSPSAWSCSPPILSGASLSLGNAVLSVNCLIVNSSIPATLTLFDLVDNSNGGTASPTDWILAASGPVNISGQSGTPPITNASVKAGTYSLAESPGPNGYSMSMWSCDTASVTGGIQVTLAPGQTANCAIRNVFNSMSASSPVFLGSSGSARNPTASIAEPINTATGNYYSTHQDLYVSGRGLSFSLSRQYNSLDTAKGPLGIGWTHSYNVSVFINATSGVVTLKDADGSEVPFSPAGGGTYTQLAGVYDHLHQNADTSFTLTRKNLTRLDFSPVGRLMAITDRNGNAQLTSYDASGNLILIMDTTGRLFSFSYDSGNHLVSVTDPGGRNIKYSYDANSNLTGYQDALGGLTQYTYDGNHRLLSATDPRGVVYVQNTYDVMGRVVTQKNGRGFATTLAYDTPTSRTTTVTDPLGNATQYVYDPNQRLLQIINAQGGINSYAYDANNNKLAISDENGNTTHLIYALNGNITSQTDALANTTLFTYDTNSNMLTTTNPGGAKTIFSYDVIGNLVSTQDAAGGRATSTYDVFGEVLSRTDASGVTSTITYDGNGNVSKVMDGLGNTTTFVYDVISRLTARIDGNAHTSSIIYDQLGRRTTISDGLGHSTKYTYDALGNVLSVTDPNGNATTYEYDGASNLVTVADSSHNKTVYTYDGNNNRLLFTNAKGNSTAYNYDSLNRRAKIIDQLGIAQSYVYDPVGNLNSTTDGNGKVQTSTFDGLNRIIKKRFADGNVISYSYDVNGNRLSMTDSHGTTTYNYDSLKRITVINCPGGNTVKYAYDAVGRRKTLTYPSGRAVTYNYDFSGRLSGVTDWAGRNTTYDYDSAGNRIAVTMGNGAWSTFSYDSSNRLIGVVNGSGLKTLTSFAYTLDASGNRTQIVDLTGGVTRYRYDGLNRLSSWVAPSGQVTYYDYDAVGNRISMTSAAGSTSYSYDAADRMLNAGTTSFTYDGNGNLLTKTVGGTTLSFTFDALNRLGSVSGGGVAAQYLYDGDGNRISQQVGGSYYQYALDLARRNPVVLNESGPDGNMDFQYGLTLLSGSSGTLEQFYQADGVGSTANVTDATGKLRASYTYDPWGRVLNPLDPLGTKDKFKFASEALDPQTGLYYLRARYYDPTVGRFISRDPLAGSIDVPMSRNRYVYALSNPVRYTDTLGLAPDQNTGNQNLGSWWYTENPTYSSLIDTSLYFAGLIVDPLLAFPAFGYAGGSYSSMKDLATDSWGNLLLDASGLALTAAGAEVAAGILGGGVLAYEVGSDLSDQFSDAYGDYMSSTVGDETYYDLEP